MAPPIDDPGGRAHAVPSDEGAANDAAPGAAELVALKRGRTISVCFPARDEAATVGGIVAATVDALHGDGALVDEVLVIDDGSVDDTAAVARAAGATVVATAEVLADKPVGRGKGNAVWAAVRVARGDLLVFCDADLRSFAPSYVTRLVAPLLTDPGAALVKGYYERPQDDAGNGGGRTTELLARPLLNIFFPHLATLRQPLSGEFAAPASVLRALRIVQGYGIESAMLIDVAAAHGASAIREVDLGVKRHRHRTLEQLAAQATEIAAVILQRAGVAGVPSVLPVTYMGIGVEQVRIADRPPWHNGR